MKETVSFDPGTIKSAFGFGPGHQRLRIHVCAKFEWFAKKLKGKTEIQSG
jgi:hypothetical protein